MKAIIGFAFFLLFLGGFAFVMLQGRQMAGIGPAGGGAGITGIHWRPVRLGDAALPEDASLYVRFEVDGNMKGHGGCNTFFGLLEQTEAGVRVGALGATEMACAAPVMQREARFFEALQNTRNFRSTGDRLTLLDESANVIAELFAETDE